MDGVVVLRLRKNTLLCLDIGELPETCRHMGEGGLVGCTDTNTYEAGTPLEYL